LNRLSRNELAFAGIPKDSSQYFSEIRKNKGVLYSKLLGNTVSSATSLIWKKLKPYRGKTKTNGLSGSKKRFYEWDYTHNDIEVYDKNGNHLGSMHPVTGNIYKKAVHGRKINI